MSEVQGSKATNNSKSFNWWYIIIPIIILISPAFLSFSSERNECESEVEFHPAGSDILSQNKNSEYYSYYKSGSGYRKEFKTKSDAVDYCMSLK